MLCALSAACHVPGKQSGFAQEAVAAQANIACASLLSASWFEPDGGPVLWRVQLVPRCGACVEGAVLPFRTEESQGAGNRNPLCGMLPCVRAAAASRVARQ
jgi:hypothetical protein